MTDPCFRLEEISSLVDLAPDDPRRRHLAECPLCQARVTAYRSFVTKSAPIDGSDPERATIALERFIAGLGAGASDRVLQSGWWSSVRARLGPRRAFALGVASAAVVLLVIFRPFPGREGPQSPVLRGGEPQESGTSSISLETPVIEAKDIVLRWSAVAGADAYEVHVFNARLERVARFSAGPSTTYRIRQGTIPSGVGSLSCRIAALRGGDELVTSDVILLDSR